MDKRNTEVLEYEYDFTSQMEVQTKLILHVWQEEIPDQALVRISRDYATI